MSGAVISGRDVTIKASADNRQLYTSETMDNVANDVALTAMGGVFSGIESLRSGAPFPWSLAMPDRYLLGVQHLGPQLRCRRERLCRCQGRPLDDVHVRPRGGVAVTNAEVNVGGAITTTGYAKFSTLTDHNMNVVSDPSKMKGIAMALAVSVIVSDANTIIGDTASSISAPT